MNRKLKICLCQVKVTPGNPQKNLERLLRDYRLSVSHGTHICVFSELIIPGYLLGDMWDRQSFLDECEECGKEAILATKDQKTVMVFGNIGLDRDKVGEDGRMLKFNAVFVANDGKLILNGGANPYNFLSKTLMPNYREFDDTRYFYDNRKLSIMNGVNIKDILMPFQMPDGTMLGIGNCEDFWDTDYSVKTPEILSRNGADILFNLSCSPYTQGKNNKRNRVFGAKAKKYGKPLVYVNCVGVQNNGKTVYSFDGNSCIYDKFGNQLNPYKPFEEGCETFDIDINGAFGETNYQEPEEIQMIHDSIVYTLKEFTQQLNIKKVVIGASGGIDSAVSAALFSEVVLPENMLLVNMPSSHNSKLTKNAAEQSAKNIGCPYKIIPIQESVDLTKKQLRAVGLDLTSFAVENVQARDRSSRILAACAASFGGAFTCNANKSEMTVGYTTLYGDLSGFVSPIGDLWKGQVYELAKYINSKREIIPLDSINVVPSAELSKNQDVTKGLGDPLIYPYHDKLFASWVERWNRATPEDNLVWYEQGLLEQEIGWDGNIKDLFKTDEDFINDLERWWNCYAGFSIAKRIQSPPIIASSRRAFGFDHRETQVMPCYSKRYKELKEKILKRRDSI
jgi:NAD+ synthase (glutamine-hydrolysing)